MSEKSKIILISSLILMLLVPAAAFGWNGDNDQQRIIRGAVYINGMPVGGQEIAAVRGALEEKCNGFPDTQVQLKYLDKQWDYSLEELGIRLDWEGALDAAMQLGKRGSFQQKVKERWKAVTKGKNITIQVNLDREKTEEKLKLIQESVVTEARDARYLYHNNQVEITPHVYGRELDLEETLELLAAASQEKGKSIVEASPLEAGGEGSKANTDGQKPPVGNITLSLPVEMSYPKVTSKLLEGKTITNVAGSYVTNFNTGQVGRSKNINIAAKYLDGYVIPPGEAFSFNEVVGPRTKEAGFEEALIIIDEQFAPGLGGGVCQVSSTLYNAALRSGLNITERTRHSKVIHYVPVGLDAAVSYGYLDLKFINNTDYYIAVCAEVHGGSLDLRLLSEKPNPFKIEVRSFIENTVKPRTEIRQDGGIPEGKQYIESPGKNGHVTRVERIWYQDDKEVKRETISRDFYPAEARVIVKGSQGKEVVKPESKKSSSSKSKKSSESWKKNLNQEQQKNLEEKVPQENIAEPSADSVDSDYSTNPDPSAFGSASEDSDASGGGN